MSGVCYGGKGRLHFIPDKAKVNSKLHRESLLPILIEDCKSRLLSGFIFQQDRAPAHTAKLAQNWIAANCSDFVGKDEWPLNSPDLKPLDYHVWVAMRERYKTFQTKPNTIDELKKVLQSIWDDLPQNSSQQTIYTEHRQKTSSLCESCGRTLWTCFEINCFHRVLNW